MNAKKLILGAAVLVAGFALSAQTAQEIAKANHDLSEGKTNAQSATLTLTDKKGKVRTREIIMRMKDYGDVKKSVIIFKTPKDVEGVGYLSFEYPDNPDGTAKDSDDWLYMPAMKKVRRISGNGTEDDFMGTDFTYDDMGNRSLAKDDITLLGEESVDGKACWKLEYKAKNQNAKISKRVFWIGKDNYVSYKGEFYDKQGKLFKKLTVNTVEQISGYWTTTKMTMENLNSNHTTVLELKDTVYDSPIDDAMFTQSALERGIIK